MKYKTLIVALTTKSIVALLFTLAVFVIGVFAQASEQDTKEAIAALNEKIAATPNDDLLYAQRANHYFNLGKLDEALADANQAIKLNPKNNIALLVRGGVKSNKKDYDGAIADYSEVIKLFPTRAYRAYYFRGEVHEKKGSYDQAIADYTKAGEIDKSIAEQAAKSRARAESKRDNPQPTAQAQPPVQASTPSPKPANGGNTIDEFFRLMDVALKYMEETKALKDKYKSLPRGVKNDQQLIELADIIQPRFEKANELLNEPISRFSGSNYPPEILKVRGQLEGLVVKNKKDSYYWSGMKVFHRFEKPVNESEAKEKILEAQLDAAIKANDANAREAARSKCIEQIKITRDLRIKLSNSLLGFAQDTELVTLQNILALRASDYNSKVFLINKK